MLKVFIVEDEPAFRQELVFATDWEAWDCMVVGSAQDGERALEAILEKRPDLVLTDIRMPGMDGLGLIGRAADALGSDAPEFLIISGYDDFEYARKALRLGVRNYLLKPLDDEELADSIRRAREELERRRGRDSLERTLNEGGRSALMLFHEYRLDLRTDGRTRYVAEAVRRIQEAYQRELSVEDVAAPLGISEGYLSRVFKKETGYTFTDYLTYYRIKRAAELLREGSYRVYEVADLVGYTDQRYFSQIFKRVVGLTPTQFKDGI